MFKNEEQKVLGMIERGLDRKEKKAQAEIKKEELKQFDLDSVLNDPAFVEFLASFPDADDDGDDNEKFQMKEDNKVLIERYSTFKDKERLSETLTDIFVEQIKLESGTSLKESDFESVNDYLAKLAVEDSKRFKEVNQSRVMFERSIAEQKRIQGEIEALLGDANQEDLEAKVSDLTEINKLGFFKTLFNGEAREKKKSVLEKYDISGGDLKDALKTEEKKLETLEKIKALQEAILKKFSESQNELLSKEFEPLQKARKIVLDRIKKSLLDIAEKPEDKIGIAEVDRVAKTLRKVKESGNYIPEYENNIDESETFLQTMTEVLLQKKLSEAVATIAKENKLSILEKAINGIMDKMTAGGLANNKNRELVLKTLKGLAGAETSVAKKLLIKRVIIKLSI